MRTEPRSYPIIRRALSAGSVHIRFLGIGGVSVSSLAHMAHRMGYTVSGYDAVENERTKRLAREGISVTSSSRHALPRDASLVVFSHAIPSEDPERREACLRGIPCVSRAAFLGYCMLSYASRIGVSGTHGKSSTVAMLERLFLAARRDPTVLCGARLPSGAPYRAGGEEVLLYEACEYRDSFLDFSPTSAVFLNLEWDHTDYYPDLPSLCDSFVRAGNRAAERVILNLDDPRLREVRARLCVPCVTFGEDARADYRIVPLASEHGYAGFSLFVRGESVGDFHLNVPGAFQMANATAALAAAHEEGIPFDRMRYAIESFGGIDGRMERIGTHRARPVFADYAHHPTEIAHTVRTLREMTGGALTVLFCPHTYSRTRDLWESFVAALSLADRVLCMPIFAARECPIDGIDSARLAAAIGDRAQFVPTAAAAVRALDEGTGAIVLMGAGDFSQVRSLLGVDARF